MSDHLVLREHLAARVRETWPTYRTLRGSRLAEIERPGGGAERVAELDRGRPLHPRARLARRRSQPPGRLRRSPAHAARRQVPRGGDEAAGRARLERGGRGGGARPGDGLCGRAGRAGGGGQRRPPAVRRRPRRGRPPGPRPRRPRRPRAARRSVVAERPRHLPASRSAARPGHAPTAARASRCDDRRGSDERLDHRYGLPARCFAYVGDPSRPTHLAPALPPRRRRGRCPRACPRRSRRS